MLIFFSKSFFFFLKGKHHSHVMAKNVGLFNEIDTMQIQSNRDAYECRICDDNFTSPIQLTVHCIVGHGLLPCGQCLKLFESKQYLDAHINANHLPMVHICSDCELQLAGEKEFHFHIIRQHFKKECPLCATLVIFDEYQNHLENCHKISNDNDTSIRPIIRLNRENRLGCNFCPDNKCLTHLERLFLHLLYFHKCSLKSLIRNIQSDQGIRPLQFIQADNDDNGDTITKCTECGLAYSLSVPKCFHQIYCKAFIYCANCTNCFNNQTTYDEHKLNECIDKTMEFTCCDSCTPADAQHLKNVHRFSPTIAAQYQTISSLINQQIACNLCNKAFNNETPLQLNMIIEHFSIYHRLNATAILRLLKPRDGNCNTLQSTTESVHKRPASIRNPEILTIAEPSTTSQANAVAQFHSDFDTKIIKYVYSSESDYDSVDSDTPTPSPSNLFHQCEWCDNRTRSKFSHAMHLHQRHGFQIKMAEFRCNICRKFFKSKRYLKQHNQNAHHKRMDNGKRFKCPFCAFRSNGKSKMRAHVSEHVESAYHPCHEQTIGFHCRYCHFIFWTKDKLDKHQINRHSDLIGDTYLTCHVCYSTFNSLVS